MSPKEHDDKRLVRRLLDRDDEAFEEFFETMPFLGNLSRATN